MKIYISGPMTSLPGWNYDAFHKAEEDLRASFVEPLNPARNFEGRTNLPRREYMRKDLEMLLQADAIYLLEGWEKSQGAITEARVAIELNLLILLQQDGGFTGNTANIVEKSEYVRRIVFGLPEPTPPKETICQEADRIVDHDRGNQYGPPEQDFARTAAMWSALLNAKVRPKDVALCMIALKLSRATYSDKRDSFCDMAGYAKCGWMCVEAEQKAQAAA